MDAGYDRRIRRNPRFEIILRFVVVAVSQIIEAQIQFQLCA